MDLINIINKKRNGEIVEDEKYAGGFWDYAGEIVSKYTSVLTQADIEILQEDIYNALEGTYIYLK